MQVVDILLSQWKADLELTQEVLSERRSRGTDCHCCVKLLQLVPACLRPASCAHQGEAPSLRRHLQC